MGTGFDLDACASACRGSVAIMDSGAGGISVLKAAVKLLPHERFCYFGDSLYTPYGEKPLEWVKERSLEVATALVEGGAKALVVACNTATSAAAQLLREKWPQLPVVGVEPALKPAAIAERQGCVLVMATPMTIKLEKFHELASRFSDTVRIEAVPCVGLAARIEQGRFDDPDLIELLESLVGQYRGKVDGVVLGCTHYPFVKRQILEVLGDVDVFDGSEGTARELKRRLAAEGLIAPDYQEGATEFFSSSQDPNELEMYNWFNQQEL